MIGLTKNLWQVLRVYEVGSKFLSGIKSIYVIVKPVSEQKSVKVNSLG